MKISKRLLLRSTLIAGVSALGVSVATAGPLTSDLPSGQPAGTKITFTIGSDGNPNEAYRLSAGPANDPDAVHVVYDYHDGTNVVEWQPVNAGPYLVVGSVLDIDTGIETHAGMQFNFGPRAPQAQFQGIATPTSNPLVAFYSAPPCPVGLQMRVQFLSPSVGIVTTTNAKNCLAGTTMNFLIGGMRESSTYVMRHEILNGGAVVGQSPFTPFQTGAAAVPFVPVVEVIPFSVETSLLEGMIWASPIVGDAGAGVDPNNYAIDLSGQVIWYVEDTSSTFRPAGGGTFWSNRADPVTGVDDQMLTKVDLLNNVVQRTTATQINRQLAAMGAPDLMNDFHHDAKPLPNGHTALMTTVERILTDEQGPGDVDVLADMIVVVDEDLQVTWFSSLFEVLDRTRLSTTGDVCQQGGGAGCGQIFLAEEANDWTHSNGIAYSPADGNLIVSVRHQDWVVKLNYADGAGDGSLVWRLGNEGDFALTSGNLDDWPSHTHDVSYSDLDTILLYDNSNIRCDGDTPPPDCRSRGQEWQIDETMMKATPILNVDLAVYARATGSAQKLTNGNSYFHSALIGFAPTSTGHMEEVTPAGDVVLHLSVDLWHYRSHRMINLYTMPPYWGVPQ